jgi:hypothetical protein
MADRPLILLVEPDAELARRLGEHREMRLVPLVIYGDELRLVAAVRGLVARVRAAKAVMRS